MQIVTIVTRRPAKTPPKAGEFATVGTMTHPGKTAALAKMQSAGISGAAQDAFARAFDRFIAGESALIAETDIDRISHVTNAADLPRGDPETGGTQTDSSETGDPQTDGSQSSEANTYNPHTFNPHTLSNVAVLMLNGGLGTTMGLDTTKSLLEAHAGLNFLEIVIRQLDNLRKRFNVQLPLILLNSDKTECETRAALPPHAAESILQSVVPRLCADTLMPIEWPDDPAAEWAPAGHGDVYGVLVRSGMLDALIEQGYRSLFVANADNLGAVPDAKIAAWFAASGADFAAEVVQRGPMDMKGGHFVRSRATGAIMLRETAQIRPEDEQYAQDFTRHSLANTNNLWLNLASLKRVLDKSGFLDLPLIVNRKLMKGSHSPEVIQLESAMAAAIGVFEHSELLRVDRSRFIPVKNTSDLLLLRSDAFLLDDDARLVDQTSSRPLVFLDPQYFGRYADFITRIPEVPSLRKARSLTVRGDVVVPRGYVAHGDAVIEAEHPSSNEKRESE